MPHPAPTNLSAVLDRIRAWARANDWKPATLARKAGIAEVVTRSMTTDAWSPSSTSIRAMEGLIPADWREGDPVPAKQDEAA